MGIEVPPLVAALLRADTLAILEWRNFDGVDPQFSGNRQDGPPAEDDCFGDDTWKCFREPIERQAGRPSCS